MFCRQEHVEEVNFVPTKVRCGTAISLYDVGDVAMHTRWELINNDNGVIVLQDPNDRMQVMVLDNELTSNCGISFGMLKATINSAEHDLSFNVLGEHVTYPKRVVTHPRKNIPIERDEEIEIIQTIKGNSDIPDREDWYMGTVIDVLENQLVVRAAISGHEQGNTYLIFNQTTETQCEGDEFELPNIYYKAKK